MNEYKVTFKWTVDAWPIIINYVNTHNDMKIKDMQGNGKYQWCIITCNNKPIEFTTILCDCKIE